MTDPKELGHLLQTNRENDFFGSPGKNGWVTAYDSWHGDNDNGAIYIALVPTADCAESLKDPSWDLSIGSGSPGCSQHYVAGDEVIVSYQRFGDSSGREPFLLVRDYHGLRPSETEVIEEFRLFHNLWKDPKTGDLLKFDDAGNEETIIRRTGKRIEVRVRELRQFLALKDLGALLEIDSVRFSTIPLAEVPAAARERTVVTNDAGYRFHVASARDEGDGRETLSRLLGKRLIAPLPKSESGMWPYTEGHADKYPEFLIGTNADGEPVRYTCEHEKLANNFGANPHAPNYLTPVYFRREVLSRYYNAPEKYSVEDGGIRCAGLWHLQIDNHLPDHVAVYLGDLGRDLPESERLHWQAHNVAADVGISKTAYLRDFRAEAADPEKEELLVKYRLQQFNDAWLRKHGFPLFLPLGAGDRHLLTSLREPLSDSQSEFDGQVLALTKILIDSINEREIVKPLQDVPPETKGIAKLAMYLDSRGSVSKTKAVKFLRDLQSLRSTGVGHRKGASYEAAAAVVQLEELGGRLAFRAILRRAITELLEPLGDEFLDGGWR